MDADASRASIGYTVANAQCQIVGNLAPITVVAAAASSAWLKSFKKMQFREEKKPKKCRI